MHLIKLSIITIGTLTLLACSDEQTESSYIQTEGIWANIKVQSDGVQSRVVTELNVSGSSGNNVVLSPQDTLVVTAGGQTKILQKDLDFFDVDYQGYFEVTAGDSLFTIALNRQKQTDAAHSTVALPASFTIHSPLNTDVFKLNQNIGIDWDASAANQLIALDLASSCTNNTGGTITQPIRLNIADDGQYTVLLSELAMFKNLEVDLSKNCTFNISLTRENQGEIDPNLKNNSHIKATQYRRVRDIVIDI